MIANPEPKKVSSYVEEIRNEDGYSPYDVFNMQKITEFKSIGEKQRFLREDYFKNIVNWAEKAFGEDKDKLGVIFKSLSNTYENLSKGLDIKKLHDRNLPAVEHYEEIKKIDKKQEDVKVFLDSLKKKIFNTKDKQ